MPANQTPRAGSGGEWQCAQGRVESMEGANGLAGALASELLGSGK